MPERLPLSELIWQIDRQFGGSRDPDSDRTYLAGRRYAPVHYHL